MDYKLPNFGYDCWQRDKSNTGRVSNSKYANHTGSEHTQEFGEHYSMHGGNGGMGKQKSSDSGLGLPFEGGQRRSPTRSFPLPGPSPRVCRRGIAPCTMQQNVVNQEVRIQDV